MTKLYCKNGDHWYERESQRGRPPLNCPEHSPPKPTTAFQRSGSLGRERAEKPVGTHSNILDTIKASEKLMREDLNKPSELRLAMEAAEREMRTETLTCEIGPHEWQRERTRGKRPARCPEHRASNFSNKPATKTTDHQAKVIESILENPRAASCRCGLHAQMSPAEIRALGGGCTEPMYVCPNLDTVRRVINA
jgi:hypothetical protein